MARSDIPDWQRQSARRLRREMTVPERTLWRALRAHRFQGAGFRRQAPLGPYIADFVSHGLKLVIEVEGGQHSGSARDAQRDAWLAREGYRVLRFRNHEVMGNLDGVLHRIAQAIAKARHPSPTRGEGAPQSEMADAEPDPSTRPNVPRRR